MVLNWTMICIMCGPFNHGVHDDVVNDANKVPKDLNGLPKTFLLCVFLSFKN